MHSVSRAGALAAAEDRVCFVGVENKTAEEIGDFKEQIYESIDQRLSECGTCSSDQSSLCRGGAAQLRLRPDQLFVPDNLHMFAGLMAQQGQPFDYLLVCQAHRAARPAKTAIISAIMS